MTEPKLSPQTHLQQRGREVQESGTLRLPSPSALPTHLVDEPAGWTPDADIAAVVLPWRDSAVAGGSPSATGGPSQ